MLKLNLLAAAIIATAAGASALTPRQQATGAYDDFTSATKELRRMEQSIGGREFTPSEQARYFAVIEAGQRAEVSLTDSLTTPARILRRAERRYQSLLEDAF